MVRTSLGYQHRVPVLKFSDGGSASHGGFEESLISRHQNGKRSQRDIIGNYSADHAECLTVGYDHAGFCADFSQSFGKLSFLCDDIHSICVEDITYRLHLRKYHPPLRCGLVDWRYKYN